MTIDVRQNLVDRKFNSNIHRVWVDCDENIATFPLLNLSYQMVGYQQYRPNGNKEKKNHPKEGRYFTYTKKESRGVWGLESWKFSNIIFVTEGIFDATRLTNRGYSAIATLSNDPFHLNNFFYIIKQLRPVVVICDDDKGGVELAKYGHTSVVVPNGDLGDASEEYVTKLIMEYAYD
jgi:hypothetical protein